MTVDEGREVTLLCEHNLLESTGTAKLTGTVEKYLENRRAKGNHSSLLETRGD